MRPGIVVLAAPVFQRVRVLQHGGASVLLWVLLLALLVELAAHGALGVVAAPRPVRWGVGAAQRVAPCIARVAVVRRATSRWV